MDRASLAARPLLALGLLAWALIPATGRTGRLLATLRDPGPNARDYERIERGYYERLIEVDRPDPAQRPRSSPPFDAGELATTVADVREYILTPGLITTHKRARWSTNSLGMRDRAYPETTPVGSTRVALVGDSIAAGWGVDDGLGFEPIAERAWDDRSAGGVEVLNFAVPGHAPGQRWEHFTRVGWGTGPDLVIVEATAADLGWDERRLRVLLPRGVGSDASVYADFLRRVDTTSLDPDALKVRLRPHREAILAGVYRRVVADCRARGVGSAWVLLPRVGKPASSGDRSRLVELARLAGFDRVADLSDTFDGRPASSLAIAPEDFHPNAEGHALIAARLVAALDGFVSSSTEASRQGRGRVPAPTGGPPQPEPPEGGGVAPR